MATYRVTVATTGREVYLVDAETPEAASEIGLDEMELIASEVLDTEITGVQLEED